MEVLVRNAEGNLNSRDRAYAAKKLARLERYFHKATKVEMVHRVDRHGHRIEITVFADGFTVRGEDREESLRAAIDKVCDRLETRLKKLKGRLIESHRRRGGALPPALEESGDEPTEESAYLERKSVVTKPMAIEEAMLQMEFVDHPFFMFRNENSGRIEVLYKRRDGGYGLLEPTD
ncbi:MAG: ribosome hibernation-promoting factor, HPF/YfiA family [Fimbriimonadaceae bacterium]